FQAFDASNAHRRGKTMDTTKIGSNGSKPEAAWGEDSGSSPGVKNAELIAAVLGLDFDPSALTFVPTDARNPYGIIAEALIQFIAKYERVPTLDEFYDIKDDTVATLPDKGLTATAVKDSLSRA